MQKQSIPHHLPWVAHPVPKKTMANLTKASSFHFYH